MKKAIIVPLACFAVAVVVSGTAAFATMAVTGGGPSVLVRMSSAEPISGIARAHDPTFRLVPPGDGYDGEMYYVIAVDPLATGEAHKGIGAYRYSHAGFGLLAWLFSFGRASAVPTAMLVLNLIGIGFAATGLARLATQHGRSAWWGLAAALNPGMIYAVTSDTAEPVALAFALWGLYFWFSGKRVTSVILLACGVISKEPLLLLPVGLVAWELYDGLRARTPGSLTRFALLAVPFDVFAAWQVFIKSRFGGWPLQGGSGQIVPPFSGWIDAVRGSIQFGVQQFDRMQLGVANLALLLCIGAAILVGAVFALRARNAFGFIFVAVAILTSTLSSLILLYPKDLLRYAALPLVLLPTVFFARAPGGDAGP